MTLEVSYIIHFSKITLTILTKPVRNISMRPKTLDPMYYKQVVDIRPKNNFEREREFERLILMSLQAIQHSKETVTKALRHKTYSRMSLASREERQRLRPTCTQPPRNF